MENCKFCNALLDGADLCPDCGRSQTADVPAEGAYVIESVVEPTEAVQPEQSDDIDTEEIQANPGLKPWAIVGIVAAIVALLGVLVGAVLYGLGIDLRPRENNSQYKDSYTVTDNTLDKKASAIVATIGDRKLTNEALQIYYWTSVYDFLDYYGSGMDYSKDLDEQLANDNKTYQQVFLDMALESWQRATMLCLLAQENGYTISADEQAYLDELPGQLVELAGTDYASVDEMLCDRICPGITEETYMEYLYTYYMGYGYFDTVYDELEPDSAQIEAYFSEHEQAYKENGVTKSSGMIADVRHILICPEGGTEDENGTVTYSDAEWAACKKKAEDLLTEWKNGDATEESFAELAVEYSEDGGSATSGGLYTDITPKTSFVENFLNWTVDANRMIGDTDVVESPYGYHIMYYVDGEELWIDSARNDYLNEKAQDYLDQAEGRFPMSANYKKMVLGYVDLSV